MKKIILGSYFKYSVIDRTDLNKRSLPKLLSQHKNLYPIDLISARRNPTRWEPIKINWNVVTEKPFLYK
jgi:hypothetical protein